MKESAQVALRRKAEVAKVEKVLVQVKVHPTAAQVLAPELYGLGVRVVRVRKKRARPSN